MSPSIPYSHYYWAGVHLRDTLEEYPQTRIFPSILRVGTLNPKPYQYHLGSLHAVGALLSRKAHDQAKAQHGLGFIAPLKYVDIWLWVYYYKIPIYPIFLLLKGDHTLNPP